jgi:arginine deiminase
MCEIIRKNGGKVIYLTDLLIQTYDHVSAKDKKMFKDKYVDEIVYITHIKKLNNKPIPKQYKDHIRKYLDTLSTKDMIFKMIQGITTYDLNLALQRGDFIAPAMSNLYFMRDTISMIGNGINIHHMKYKVRDRESLLT